MIWIHENVILESVRLLIKGHLHVRLQVSDFAFQCDFKQENSVDVIALRFSGLE